MCGRFTIAAEPEQLSDYFGVENTVPDFKPSYNITPSSAVPVICQTKGAERRLSMMRWGLIPHWTKEPSAKYKMINAKVERLGERQAYRGAYKHRRCLVPATGFYEWRTENGVKQPYFINLPDDELFAFAGLWEYWQGSKGMLYTFTIITTPANELIRPVHHRMPAILTPFFFNMWLDPTFTDTRALQALLDPYESDEMEMYRVSPVVNNPSNDWPDLILPLAS